MAKALLWLDLREAVAGAVPGLGHAELVAAIEAQAMRPDALVESIVGLDEPPAPQGERVNIYIESNQHDTDLWQDLGERIKCKWDDLVQKAGSPPVPPLSLEALGLPLADDRR